jgi:hypothetical protein
MSLRVRLHGVGRQGVASKPQKRILDVHGRLSFRMNPRWRSDLAGLRRHFEEARDIVLGKLYMHC